MATSNQRTTPLLLLVLALVVGFMLYSGTVVSNLGFPGVKAARAHVVAIRDTIARLDAQTDSAKRELARSTAEELRQKLDQSRASLALLRRLVPDRNEVPNLLDDVSTRAKIRGVSLSQVAPLPVSDGPAPFDTYLYNMSVIGHYDQIGEFLADVASLQRIIVPQSIQIAAASSAAAKALGDTSGALLKAKFQVRTFVKSAGQEGATSGT